MIIFSKKYFYTFRIKASLKTIRDLLKTIFNTLLDENYPIYPYNDEKKIHFLKKKWWQQKNSFGQDEIAKQLDTIFICILQWGWLRHRVDEFVDLKFCHLELKEISKAMDALFFNFINKKNTDVLWRQLQNNIHALEDLYEQVLTVVIQNPYCYLLFISSLQQLMLKLEMLKEMV